MQTPRNATRPRRAAAAATTIIATVVAATAITAITPTARADDNGFFDPFLFIDFDRWSTVDYPGDGVTIRADGRLEFSSTQGPGSAKIVTRDALTTDAPFQAIVDYSMTFPFPGATRTGLRFQLIGAPDPSDAFVLDIYRWGTTYWYEWTLFDDGHGIDGGFGQTNANISDLVVSYDAVNDFVYASSDETIPGDPVAAVVYSLTERTGTTRWRLALGGFVQGITIPVEPGEAFWDSLLVDGCFVDPADGGGSGNDGGSGSSPLGMSARSDSEWFQRGTGGSRSGWTVSHLGDIDDDGVDDFAVGAPRESTRAANAGSVRVYSGADGRQIFARHGQAGDQRGYAVGAAGDFNGDGVPDIIVGAPKAGANARGKVYVYSGRAPHALLWSRVGERGGDTLGSAVAGVGDLNFDGYDDVLIGAPGHDDKRGRAYVHLGPDGASGWIGEGAAAGDQYGRVVAGPGDTNGDGFPDLLVTAPLTDLLGTNSGSFILYSGLHGFPLVAHHGQAAGDKFGMAACGIDDVDGDGRPDLIVGAPGHDGGANNGGAAFIYRGLSGGLLLETFGSTAGEQYGRAVCGVRDLDGDDVPELAVGSPRHDAGGANAGRVSVVSGAAGTLLISINGERAGTRFGGSISGSFTQNSLGLVDMIAGAWGFRPENRRGCAYCYAFGF